MASNATCSLIVVISSVGTKKRAWSRDGNMHEFLGVLGLVLGWAVLPRSPWFAALQVEALLPLALTVHIVPHPHHNNGGRRPPTFYLHSRIAITAMTPTLIYIHF